MLRGLANLSEKPQYISIELEKESYDGATRQIQLLQDIGYRNQIVQQDPIPGSTIQTNTVDGETLNYTFEDEASGPFGGDLPNSWVSAAAATIELKRISFFYRAFGHAAPFRCGSIGRAMRLFYKVATGYRGSLPAGMIST